MHAVQEIPVFVDLFDDGTEINDLVDLFAAMHGYTEDQYHVVHTSETEVYAPLIAALREDGAVLSVNETAWVVDFKPDQDPTIEVGEPSFPKALRVIRVIPIH